MLVVPLGLTGCASSSSPASPARGAGAEAASPAGSAEKPSGGPEAARGRSATSTSTGVRLAPDRAGSTTEVGACRPELLLREERLIPGLSPPEPVPAPAPRRRQEPGAGRGVERGRGEVPGAGRGVERARGEEPGGAAAITEAGARQGTAGVAPIQLFVMSIRGATPRRRGVVVFTHGAGSASSASWDLRAGDYSFMRFLACAGFDTYAVDVRGFGGSTMPPELLAPAEAAPPAVRAEDVVLDVHAAVLFAARTSSVATVDLVGWSWGAEVAGLYAGRYPDHVRRLTLLSPVFDRRWPARHATAKAWYPLVRAELDRLYSEEREERVIWDEFVSSLFRFTTGPELRLPNGPYRDLYGEDAPIWDPAKVRAPVLVLRGERDAASLDVHARALFDRLTQASSRRYLVLGGMGHFVYRERRYRETQSALLEWLLAPLP